MKKDISIIGVPMDLGQARRGVDMGPSAIRYTGITERLRKLDYTIRDLGDIEITRSYEEDTSNQGTPKNLDEVIRANQKLRTMVSEEIKRIAFRLC